MMNTPPAAVGLLWTLDTVNFEPITSESDTNDPLIQKALLFLYNRGLFPEQDGEFYVCRQGKYANRLIIPYIEENREWVYFQARALTPGQVPKYLNPGRSSGVMSRNVILPFEMWGTSYVYVTEGPLDALTLRRRGYNATCTNGSNPSRAQVEMIYGDGGTVIVAYDNDEAGTEGLEKFDKIRKQLRLEGFSIATPGKCKDWNELHVRDEGFEEAVENTTPYSDFFKMKQKIKNYFKPL
jgi:DNA primase